MNNSLSRSAWLDVAYVAAILVMVADSGFVAFSVMAVDGQADVFSVLRTITTPILFDLFVVGLISQAMVTAGRMRRVMWVTAMLALLGAGVVQIGAIQAHVVDLRVAERMGEMYYVVRAATAVMAPAVVAVTGSVKIWRASVTDVVVRLEGELAGMRSELGTAQAALMAERARGPVMNGHAAAIEPQHNAEDLERALVSRPDRTRRLDSAGRVTALRRLGYSNARIAEELGCSVSTVEKAIKLARDEGLL